MGNTVFLVWPVGLRQEPLKPSRHTGPTRQPRPATSQCLKEDKVRAGDTAEMGQIQAAWIWEIGLASSDLGFQDAEDPGPTLDSLLLECA